MCTATVPAAEAMPPREGTNQCTSLREEELEELLEASNTACAELERTLRQTELTLTQTQQEVERVQLLNPLETLSVSSDGSRPSEGEGEDGMATNGGAEDAGSGDAPSLLTALLAGQAKARQAAKEKQSAEAAKRARRQAVANLKLPTEQQPSWSTVDWTDKKFADAEANTQKRRAKKIDGSASAKPRKGKHGWRHNSRQGLVGAVQYWADGSRTNVVHMLLGLIQEFGVAEDIRGKLFQKSRREAETDRIIVDRLVDALDVLKGCQTEQQRKDYLLALALVAPPRASERTSDGCARRIAARLRVSRGKRSKRRGQRPYAFETATERRTAFDTAKARYSLPVGPLLNGQQRALVPDALQVGEKVLTHNGPAELTRFTEDGGCVVTYRVGDDYAERKYSDCYSKAKGSARLRRMPPSLSTLARATSALSIPDSTRKAILDHFSSTCPTSPSTRDVMRRRVGPFVVQEKVCAPRPTLALPALALPALALPDLALRPHPRSARPRPVCPRSARPACPCSARPRPARPRSARPARPRSARPRPASPPNLPPQLRPPPMVSLRQSHMVRLANPHLCHL